MRIGILTFEQYHGKKNIHSSKIRGKWIADNLEGAEIFKFGQEYDVLIYQKVYWFKHAESFKGKKILDMCDADFLWWQYPIKQMLENIDAVTCSTKALADKMATMTDKPVIHIKDRFDWSHYSDKPTEVRNIVADTVAWHGYSENYPMLDAAIPALVNNGIKKLIVISNKGKLYQLPPGMRYDIEVVFYPWSNETIEGDLKKADIVINPQSKFGRYGYKSENKTIFSEGLGIPVAHTDRELKFLLDPINRKKEAVSKFDIARRDYDIKLSVREYKSLIEKL